MSRRFLYPYSLTLKNEGFFRCKEKGICCSKKICFGLIQSCKNVDLDKSLNFLRHLSREHQEDAITRLELNFGD
jgi:hypothetical protein